MEIILSKILNEIPVMIIDKTGHVDPVVFGVTQDSRQIQPGWLFVACHGGAADGHRFIPDAISKGAVAVVGSDSAQKYASIQIPYFQVEEPRLVLACVAAALNDYPSRKLTVIGVTGTDGKTTTSNIIYHILKAAGLKAGIISTVNAVIGDRVLDTGFHVTTPEAPDIQNFLAQMVASGLTHVVLESTSHGLAQYRVAACEYDVAVVTNITHEHLDYHGSYEAYRAAKGKLFTELSATRVKKQGNPRVAILNRDDNSYEYLSSISPKSQYSYSLSEGDLVASNIVYSPSGLSFDVRGPVFSLGVQSKLIGSFNVSNILAAIGATVIALGINPVAAEKGIAELTAVPGRMEQIDLGQNFIAIVDFAHTPNALKRALETAREISKRRVIAIFGSAGLRDRQKRRMMAEVSIDIADVTILTAEDPRTESLDDILAEMASAASAMGGQEGRTFYRIPDRGRAIEFAVKMAQPGDLVIACGKGHEQSMCFGTTEYAWDDRTAMRAALSAMLGINGPEIPYLPTRSE